MMTTSSDPKDLLEALNGQAHRYITTPVAVPVFLATLRAIVADGGPCELDAARAADLQSWIRELDRC